MRFRNTKTGAIIDVKSELKGPWEKMDGGAIPAAPISSPDDIQPAEIIKKKPGRKAKK